jgi:hypothetical protein
MGAALGLGAPAPVAMNAVARWIRLEAATAPPPRSGHAAALDGRGCLWVFGGFYEGPTGKTGYTEVRRARLS